MFSPLFSFTSPTPTHIYTLSLHDALPISKLAYGVVVVLFASGLLALMAIAHQPEPLPAADMTVGESLKVGLRFLWQQPVDRKSTRLNSSHLGISYAVFCLKKKKDE